MPLDHPHKLFLMSNLIRNPRIVHLAANVLKPVDFNSELERHFAVVWEVSLDFYKQTNRLIDEHQLKANIEQQLVRNPGFVTAAQVSEMSGWISFTYSLKEDHNILQSDTAMTWLQEFIDDKQVRPELQNVEGTSDIPEMLRKLTTRIQATRVATLAAGSSMFDLSNPAVKLTSGDRSITSCTIIDTITGGIRPREVIAIMGPTGGGKTTLALQIAVAIAKHRGCWTHIYSYEQPIFPEVRERVWSCATGISRLKIEAIKFEDMDPADQRAVERHGRELQKVLGFDMTERGKGQDGMEEVEAHIAAEVAKGCPPGAVIIDWMSIMARRYEAKRNTQRSDIRGLLLSLVSQAKTIASRFNCNVFLVQQLSGEAAGRTSFGAQTDHTDAMDCKGFALECDFAVIIGPLDEDNRCKIRSTKARNVRRAECNCKLDGEFNRFIIDDKEYTSVRDRNTGKTVKVEVSKLSEITPLHSVTSKSAKEALKEFMLTKDGNSENVPM